MARMRVPETIPAFNDYISLTDKRLLETNPSTGNPYWQDYGLSSARQTAWHNHSVKWKDEIYANYTDPEKSTSIAKGKVRKFMNVFRKFAAMPLRKIVASDMAGIDEEKIFNVKIRRAHSTRPETGIDAQCAAIILNINYGKAHIKCREPEHDGRARIAKGADSVQCAYAITDKETPIEDMNDPRFKRELFFKSSFTLDLGSANRGKWVVLYFRWYRSRHPLLPGGWGGIMVDLIR